MTIPLFGRIPYTNPATVFGSNGFGGLRAGMNWSWHDDGCSTYDVFRGVAPTADESNALMILRELGKKIDNQDDLLRFLRKTRSSPKKSSLPMWKTEALRSWVFLNPVHPYPDNIEKEKLVRILDISHQQLRNWFSNLRKREFFPVCEKNEPPKTALQKWFVAHHGHYSKDIKRVKRCPLSGPGEPSGNHCGLGAQGDAPSSTGSDVSCKDHIMSPDTSPDFIDGFEFLTAEYILRCSNDSIGNVFQ